MRTVFIPLLLCIIALPGRAQVNTDSLFQIWHDTSRPDTTRLAALEDIEWDLLYRNPDSTYALVLQQLDFATKAGSKKWQAQALNTMGTYYYIQADYAKAIESHQKSLAIRQEIGDKTGVAASYNNLGLVYRNLGKNLKAIEYHQKSLTIKEEMGNKKGIASTQNNLGILYIDLGDFPKALSCFEKALQISQERNDQTAMALSYDNIGTVYLHTEDYAKALEYLYKSITIREKTGEKLGLSSSYTNIGYVYKMQGKYALSLDYYQKSLAIQEELGENYSLGSTYYNIGNLYQAWGNYGDAIKWCQKSLHFGQEISAVPVQTDACGCLYESYKARGDTKTALAYYERFIILADSMKNNETAETLRQMEFDKQVMLDSLGKEEDKLKVEVAHQRVVHQKNKTLNFLLISAMVVFAIALALWSRMLYFRRNSQIFQDKAENLEKQQLLNEIALLKSQVNPHFLFNSLSILASLVRTDPDLSEQFIDQLSRSYRYILEQKEETLVTLRTEIEFIRSYLFLLKIRFENKFDVQFDLPEPILDNYKIAPLTLQLLIENAVKHNRMSLKESLIVHVSQEGELLVVKNHLQPRTTPAASTGIGLHNIKTRYALLTDRPVWSGKVEEEFVVKVPLL